MDSSLAMIMYNYLKMIFSSIPTKRQSLQFIDAISKLKRIFNLTLIVGVQLIALWVPVGDMQQVNFSDNHFGTQLQINQSYQPPSTIGSPVSNLGSGTR